MSKSSSTENNNNKTFINIICDETLLKQYERLGLPSGLKLLTQTQQQQQENNNLQQQSLSQGSNNDNNNKTSTNTSLSATCEDIGMEKAVVITATKNKPHVNVKTNNHDNNSEILCVISVLSSDQLRQLYAKGMLFRFLRDGLKMIHKKYDSSSSSNNVVQQNKTTSFLPTVLYSPKLFLVVEYPKTTSNDNNNNSLDLGIVSDLLLFQTTCVGICHVSFCNSSSATTANQNQNNSTTTKDEVSGFIQAVGQYLVRKSANVVSLNNNQTFGISAKIRDRDDTLSLLEPQYLTRGKIAPEDWAAAYKAFLCEVEGLNPARAVAIISRFPTLKSLLSAIDSRDQQKLAILADSVGTNNANNNRVGDALVQKIIDKMSKKFDERVALEKTARDFL